MDNGIRIKQFRRLTALLLLLALLAAQATTIAGAGASLLDGGGFPTATPTATQAPTLEPTQTPTNIPLESVFPAETPTLVVPYPMEQQSVGAEAVAPQAAAASSGSSPSLILVALPFLGAFLLLALIVGNWLRRARG